MRAVCRAGNTCPASKAAIPKFHFESTVLAQSRPALACPSCVVPAYTRYPGRDYLRNLGLVSNLLPTRTSSQHLQFGRSAPPPDSGPYPSTSRVPRASCPGAPAQVVLGGSGLQSPVSSISSTQFPTPETSPRFPSSSLPLLSSCNSRPKWHCMHSHR